MGGDMESSNVERPRNLDKIDSFAETGKTAGVLRTPAVFPAFIYMELICTFYFNKIQYKHKYRYTY